MLDSLNQRRHIHFQTRFDNARDCLRRLGFSIQRPFRRPRTFSKLGLLFNEPVVNPYTNATCSTSVPFSVTSLDLEGMDPPPSASEENIASPMDGIIEKRSRKARNSSMTRPVSAIFVHAGAGYHSITNERVHLLACSEAARSAMNFLRSGGSAVDAVEAAIRVLEDKEITNAGYGSNLTMEGVVECDATIVDYLGRSGACGATAKIKNPISLARLILDTSTRPLSLRRVPPNLLVGDGATDFAWEHSMSIVPHDFLVSKNARDRFIRWKEDLRRAGGGPLCPDTPKSTSSTGCDEVDLAYEDRVRVRQRRDHTNALLTATWNEGQPDSPQAQSPAQDIVSRESTQYFNSRTEDSIDYSAESTDITTPKESTYTNAVTESTDSYSVKEPTDNNTVKELMDDDTVTEPLDYTVQILARSRSPSVGLKSDDNPTKRARYSANGASDGNPQIHSLLGTRNDIIGSQKSSADPRMSIDNIVIHHRSNQAEGHDGCLSPDKHETTDGYFITENFLGQAEERKSPRVGVVDDEDFITDTVGAIAIDSFGNIAAGSSSGGIGMKHRGRVGPAALVGIGTAVIPVDSLDTDGITVAAVTSGTGEHMATTMASQKCAERLYYCNKRGPAGVSIPATEEEAMQSFIQDDFMSHASVKNSHSTGAIGVMAVKKTPVGFFLHFAHNTESFALASLHSNEREAKCVMSRLGDHTNVVVQGGRKIRCD